MVSFNPNHRPTARELLFDEIFENVPDAHCLEESQAAENLSCNLNGKCS